MGDHEWYSNYLLLPHWATAHSCWECHLTGPQQMETLAEPLDQTSQRTVAEELNCRLSEHSLFTIPGVSHFNICQDAMHILFCGGVFGHAMGNALKHWCYHSNCMGRKSLKDKVSLIWNKMQHHYQILGVENKLPLLKATMFINTDRPHQEKPFLKVKAGECKSLVHVFAQLAVDFHTGDEISDAILALCESMAEFTDLMDSSSRHPTDAQCARAEEIMTSFMAQYKWLQLPRPTDFMWHTVIKFHTGKHLAASFKLGNPKFSWCFKSEDYCGRIARLAHSCSFGCKALALATKIAEKYRLMMFIRQWQFDVWKRVQVKEQRFAGTWTKRYQKDIQILEHIYIYIYLHSYALQKCTLKINIFSQKYWYLKLRFWAQISIFHVYVKRALKTGDRYPKRLIFKHRKILIFSIPDPLGPVPPCTTKY